MKTFEQFFNENYDYTNVDIKGNKKYQPKLDVKHSYMAGITQPGGGNIVLTPNECEEQINKHKKSKNKEHKNDNNRTNDRSTHKIHISRKINKRGYKRN